MEPRSPSKRTTYGVPARRQEVVDRLTEAYARNMLDQREVEARLARAEAAESVEELEALMADFPARDRAAPQVAPATGPRIVARFSSDTHVWDPDEGPVLASSAIFGDSRIDLRAWRGSGQTLTLTLTGSFGDVQLKVPAGTRIVRRLKVYLGDFRLTPAKRTSPIRRLWNRFVVGEEVLPPSPFPVGGPPPTLILEGRRFFGDVKIVETPEP